MHLVMLLFMPPASVHGTTSVLRGVALTAIIFVLCSLLCHERIIIYPLLPLALHPCRVSPEK